MVFNEECWAMLGCVDSLNCHIAALETQRLELPMVDVGTTDPTVTETRVPWLLHNFPDAREQGYSLADYVFKEWKYERVAVLRAQTRDSRIGVEKFTEEAQRLGWQPVLEIKYTPGDKDFSHQLRLLDDADVEAIVLWGDAADAGLILKQMRAQGMFHPVFGGGRLAYPELLQVAGPAAEGLAAVSNVNPARLDPQWMAFCDAYRRRFHEEPIDYAAYAFDGMQMLIGAIEKAGLNRGRIMEVLRAYQMKTYDGVTGEDYFDYTLNNLAPLHIARVKHGKFEYWLVPRQGGYEGFSWRGGQ
jgi:branched-chain amino acid transport system substrate-binding protein